MTLRQIEKILIPLRELYTKDIEHRTVIVEYVNNFKSRNHLLPTEFKMLTRQLERWAIPFDDTLFRSVLSKPLLTVELVPKTCWYSNVRDHVDKETWDVLRRSTYKKAGYICEICGGKGKKWPVECHEVWHYDDEKYIQTLRGLISLCPDCHQVKHIGFAGIQGKEKQAKIHLGKVNGWPMSKTEEYLAKVWQLWSERSQYEWNLDLSWLEKLGVKIESKRDS